MCFSLLCSVDNVYTTGCSLYRRETLTLYPTVLGLQLILGTQDQELEKLCFSVCIKGHAMNIFEILETFLKRKVVSLDHLLNVSLLKLL